NVPAAANVTETRSAQSSPRSFWWIPTVGGVALAGAGVGVMVLSGATAAPLTNATTTAPLGLSQAASARDSANTQLMIGTILAATGGAAVLAGMGLLIFGGPSMPAPS